MANNFRTTYMLKAHFNNLTPNFLYFVIIDSASTSINLQKLFELVQYSLRKLVMHIDLILMERLCFVILFLLEQKHVILYLCCLVFHFVGIFDSHNILRNIIIYIDESTLMKFITKLPSTPGQMHRVKVPLSHAD